MTISLFDALACFALGLMVGAWAQLRPRKEWVAVLLCVLLIVAFALVMLRRGC